jgi:hypothetical protein
MKSVVFAETHAVFGINDVVAVVRLAERLRRRVRRLHSGAVFSFLGAMNRLEAVFTAAASLFGEGARIARGFRRLGGAENPRALS